MRRKLRFRNNADSEAADDRFAQALPAFNLKTGSTVTPLVVAAVSKAFWVVELAVRTIISSSCNSFRREYCFCRPTCAAGSQPQIFGAGYRTPNVSYR